MLFRYAIVMLMAAIMPAAYSQLFTFRDGQIGVNFLGYHASAGLGGLLTGNAAHGGLSASAGTPFGQRAAAGLGGEIDQEGRPRGGGFAAATAGNGIGASAALGGNVNEHGGSGGLGSEAHGLGYSAKKVELTSFPQQPRIPQNVKSVDIQQLPEINQRSSFAESSAVAASNNVVASPAVQPLPFAGRRRRYKTKYVERRNGGTDKIYAKQVDSRVADEEEEDVVPAPRNNPVGYTNFFDFGYFSDLAASVANAPHPATQTGNAITIRKQKGQNTVELEKLVIPNSPQKDVKTVEENESSEEEKVIVKTSTKRRSTSAGGETNVTRKNFQLNQNFFNDIFNIPISTLNAVNQFLNNGLAALNGTEGSNTVTTKTKTKTVSVQHGDAN